VREGLNFWTADERSSQLIASPNQIPSMAGVVILCQISRATAQNADVSKFDVICTLADKLRSQASVTDKLAGRIDAQF
jgi:hypothetical protein